MAAAAAKPAKAADAAAAGGGDLLDDILRSTAWVMRAANATKSVTIDSDALAAELKAHAKAYTTASIPAASWGSQPYHFADAKRPELTAQYVLVLDALNFCFWPLAGYEYEHLAGGLKRAIVADPKAFDAERLSALTARTLHGWLQPNAPLRPNNAAAKATAAAAAAASGAGANPAAAAAAGAAGAADESGEDDGLSFGGFCVIPLLAERVRALREVGRALTQHFDGQALALIKSAKNSAVRLVELVAAHFPCFRDHTVYRGRQIALFKRAQIFVGDVWGAFNGAHAFVGGGAGTAKGAGAGANAEAALPLGSFYDIDRLTCFADYRVPQLLRALGILRYSKALAQHIDTLTELVPGSEMEVELRAATIQAVQQMQAYLKAHDQPILSIQLDWVLWERGEAQLASLPPHHRTLTIFY